MKLYTEEQVIKALELSKTVGWGEKGMEYIYSDNEILERLTPIELPSDEEIEEGFDTHNEKYYIFSEGAKWMRDKILNK